MFKRANLDLPDLIRGTKYEVTINLVDENGDPQDLSAFTGVRGYIRTNVDASTTVLEPVWAITAPATGGVVTVTAASTSTTGITTGNCVYDAEVYDGASPPNVQPILYGKIKIVKEVTR